MIADAAVQPALLAAGAGALALACGAPLGVLLIARRMSLVGDSLSHAVLPGAAAAYLIAGPDPLALTVGALAAGLVVGAMASLLARTRRLPEDAAFAVFALCSLAAGVLMLGRHDQADQLLHLLFGDSEALDIGGLLLSACVAGVTLAALVAFLHRFAREDGQGFDGPHLLLVMLVVLNLVAGFRTFGALMTVGLIMAPAAAARFWSRDFRVQAVVSVAISAVAGWSGLVIARVFGAEPGAVMVLAAGALFVLSGSLAPAGWFRSGEAPAP